VRALVTGGTGFLGSHLCRALLARGASVSVLARGHDAGLEQLGVAMHAGDLRDRDAVTRAAEGADVVFHTAAKAGGWGRREEFESVNVAGTKNVIDACRDRRVPRLVYTSSPSVVYAKRDIEGGNESLPYARTFLAHYPRTKAAAERLVLESACDELRTVALRPHFIWGPGDHHLLPRLVARAKAGRLRRIGRRDVLTDTTYVDNCVDAHLAAADALSANPSVSGRVYFISDGSPIGVWTMAARLLEAVDGGTVDRSVPTALAYVAGGLLELVHAVFRIDGEPVITRFAVSELSHAQWFDMTAARRDLGYSPRVTVEEGLRRLAAMR
jgi:nucleoside-diphosphate-sugar epimerase